MTEKPALAKDQQIELEAEKTRERVENYNAFIRRYETTLQLHALRYEGSERAHELFAKSAITLNGGALLAIITTERIHSSGNLTFAAWFVVGTIAFLLGSFVRYYAKRNLMNSPHSYFPELVEEDVISSRVRNNTNLLGEASIWCLFFSVLAFAIGCSHGFIVMNA